VSASPSGPFEPWLARWALTPDGAPIVTQSSRLLPVRQGGRPAMLKIATEPEERRGAALMPWWEGDGAVRVLALEEEALLMERAMGTRSLIAMARAGQDDEASRVLCATAARLHLPRLQPPPDLVPLPRWFAQLGPAAARKGGILARCARVAERLLADPRESVVLHGDLHHGNVLDCGARGWCAIDPKGLAGERCFDFANILRDPDFEIAVTPGRMARQVAVIAAAAGLDPVRLLQWVFAFAGLSAAWIFDDGGDPRLDLAVAAIAEAELARAGAPVPAR